MLTRRHIALCYAVIGKGKIQSLTGEMKVIEDDEQQKARGKTM